MYVLRTVQGTGMRTAARLWPGASNMTERERKDHFEHRAKNPKAVFQWGAIKEGIKLT